MRLFPRLPRAVARALAAERAVVPINDLAELASTSFPSSVYAPTGGQRISDEELSALRGAILEDARPAGYPNETTDLQRRLFDRELAVRLYEGMKITPHEASQSGVWSFLACVLVPDVVRWRFPGDANGTRPERFLGNARGVRNALGRVWWRAYTFRDPHRADPYGLLAHLGEDEFVQIMERPRLAGDRDLVHTVTGAFIEATASHPSFRRSEMLREVVKRLRRLLPHVAFEALDEEVTAGSIRTLFAETIALAADPAFGRRPPVRPTTA